MGEVQEIRGKNILGRSQQYGIWKSHKKGEQSHDEDAVRASPVPHQVLPFSEILICKSTTFSLLPFFLLLKPVLVEIM